MLTKLKHWVNIINIIIAPYATIFLRQKKLQSQNITRESCKKHFCNKNTCVKCLWNQHLVSISWTLYAHIFHTNFFPKQNVTRHVTREKLPNQRSYEKFVRKMLMKLTPVVNFINILCEYFFVRKCSEHIFSSYVLAL